VLSIKGETRKLWEGTVGGKCIVQRILFFLLIAAILIASCLRPVHLEADFPKGLDWSSDLYTDEGWYSGNAIAWALTGRWYVPGDFNSMITLPFFQWIQMGAFSVLGVSLASARLSVAVLSLLSLVLAFALARRYGGEQASWITVGLLSTDYAYFAYSRIALLEIPLSALTLGSIWLAGATSLPAWLGLGLSSILFSAAVLTKTSALPLLAVVLYAVWLRLPGVGIFPVTNWKRRTVQVLAFLGMVILILGGETLIVMHENGAEYLYLTTTNVTLQIPNSIQTLFIAFARILFNGWRLDPWLVIASLGFGIAVFISGAFAHLNRLVMLAAIWIGVYVIYLGLRTYLPPRYFVPLIVAMSFLIGGSIPALLRRFNRNRSIWLFLSLVAFIGMINFVQIIRYMSQPQYTFREMGRDMAGRIREAGGIQPVYLIGNLADSLSLVTGFPAINTQLGYKDLNWRLATYHPQFYVSLGLDSREQRRLNKQYLLREMAAYQVFGNYYHNKSVYLFQLVNLTGPN
jgi:4-amino-4-deoxy-L-arabinose transferase-like glycosyltransferase